MVKGFYTKWGTCSRTVSLNTTSCALASWDNFIAAGLFAGDIITLDAITGTHISKFSAHTGRVNSIAFSSDGKFLVSGGDDNTINLWDIQTGGIVRTFHGHINEFMDIIYSVSISMDHNMIVSGSSDGTICMWNTQTGECCWRIKNDAGYQPSVVFSPTNPKLFMSAAGDQTIRQWDTNGHQIGPTYAGKCVAFSPDGTHFVGWGGEVATIQSSDSGVVIATVEAPYSSFECCCFSPNSKLIAGAFVNNIYVWDITGSKTCLVETCIGHTENIASLTFCSSLISSSYDWSVKFWKIGTPLMDPVATDLGNIPPAPAPIISVSLQAEYSIAISCDKTGVVKTWDILTGICKATLHTSVRYSERDMRVVDNRLIVVWCTFGQVHIWDSKKEEHPQQAKTGPNTAIKSLRISGDGSKVFLLGKRCVQALSTWTGEVVGEVRFEDNLLNKPFIVDGSRVWVQTKDSPVQGWDFETLDLTPQGSTPILLSEMPPDPSIPHLDFIDGNREQDSGLSRIKDRVTGKEVYWLPERYGEFSVAQWDGQYLVAGYRSGEVMILDFNYMALQ